jgi:hypothetical protein
LPENNSASAGFYFYSHLLFIKRRVELPKINFVEKGNYMATTKRKRVGTCIPCNGTIVSITEEVLDVSPADVRLGGQNPMKEIETCSCEGCGLLYNPEFFKQKRPSVKK